MGPSFLCKKFLLLQGLSPLFPFLAIPSVISWSQWIKHVQQEGPDALREALSPFRNWRQEILAFFDFLPILVSNGFVEGKNNRTKTIMRQAFGYRNRYNLLMRILL